MIICFVSHYICHYQLLKSMFYTLAPSLCIHAMIGPIMENLPQLSNVFCIIVLCSAVIIYKKVIELLALVQYSGFHLRSDSRSPWKQRAFPFSAIHV